MYVGLKSFSARAEAGNLTAEELEGLLAYARSPMRERPGRVYVTFNTLVDDCDIAYAVEELAVLSEIHPDGIIVQDLGIARIARHHFPNLELHASTQLVAHNLEGVLALKEMGFSRVVLSRELSIAEISAIASRCGCELEVFVHGALCYSISGLCLFSAMELQRSGNKGRCAYCCRHAYTDPSGAKTLPFSMRDLRLDDELQALEEAGVASLKIEGRMKSPLYVSTVTRRYRDILDGVKPSVTREDIESVFSRRTTTLYAHGEKGADSGDIIDSSSLGHLGTPIGTVKRLTKDRDGRTWLRFHTSRPIERHDGLQFSEGVGEKPFGFGIGEMRKAISRRNVFEAGAGEDVEILLPVPHPGEEPVAPRIKGGMTVYMSASGALKRRFTVPSWRPADYAIGRAVDIDVSLAENGITVAAKCDGLEDVTLFEGAELSAANDPSRTVGAVKNSFSRLGGTHFCARNVEVSGGTGLFAPMGILNALRRRMVEALQANAALAHARACSAAMEEIKSTSSPAAALPQRKQTRSLRIDLNIAPKTDIGDFDELTVAIGHCGGREAEAALEAAGYGMDVRLALPPWTRDGDLTRLRSTVRHLVRSHWLKWEAADLATLRILKSAGVTDLTADWTLYAANRAALAELADLGVKAVVASPELGDEARSALFEASRDPSMPDVIFLERQSTPLFMSVTKPAVNDVPSIAKSGANDEVLSFAGPKGARYCTFMRGGIWVTVSSDLRTWRCPKGASSRVDEGWDAR